MVYVTLKQSSRPAGENCRVFCDRQANFYLNCADAVLVRVQTPDGKYHFLWQSATKQDTLSGLYPAFYDENFDVKFTIAVKHQIIPNEIFCYGGECYYLAENDVGTRSIRLIDMYSSQKIVEQIACYDSSPNPVEQVYLEKVYKLSDEKKLVTVAWFVQRGSFCDQLPVFEKDAEGFSDLLRGVHVCEAVAEGDILSLHGKMYILQRDRDGKLCLAHSKLKPLKLNASQV